MKRVEQQYLKLVQPRRKVQQLLGVLIKLPPKQGVLQPHILLVLHLIQVQLLTTITTNYYLSNHIIQKTTGKRINSDRTIKI